MKGIVLPLAITLAVQSLTSMAMIAPAVMAPVVALELGASAQGIGWFVALEYLFAMTSGLACGGLIWRFGSIRVCQASVALGAIGLITGCAGMWSLVFAAAVLVGSGYGLVNPVSSHILVRAAPPRMMSLIFSIKQTGVPLGGALAGAIVPALVLYLSWRWSAMAVALLCLIAAGALQAVHTTEDKGVRVAPSKGFLAPLRMVFANPPVLEMSIVSLIFGTAQLSLFTYFVSYLNLELGYSLVASGLVYSAAHTAGIVGRVLWGALADRWLSPRRMLGLLGVTMALAGAMVAGFTAQWPIAALVMTSVLFGASAVGWNGIYLAEVARLVPPDRVGAVTGGTQVLTFIGALATPPLFGLLVGFAGSYARAYLAFSLLPGLAGIYLLLRSRHR